MLRRTLVRGARLLSSTRVARNETLDKAVGLVDRLKQNQRVLAQLQAVQLAVTSAGPSDSSIMAQMALLANKDVRSELEKLGKVIEDEGISFTAEETMALMKVLKNKL